MPTCGTADCQSALRRCTGSWVQCANSSGKSLPIGSADSADAETETLFQRFAWAKRLGFRKPTIQQPKLRNPKFAFVLADGRRPAGWNGEQLRHNRDGLFTMSPPHEPFGGARLCRRPAAAPGTFHVAAAGALPPRTQPRSGSWVQCANYSGNSLPVPVGPDTSGTGAGESPAPPIF